LIGLKYLDYSMFHLALESFEKALEIYPENPNVLYYAGLTSARLSKTAGSESERNDFIDRAVRYYKASMSLKSRFSSPMYGLAVLYVYELNQPELAIPLLETYNSIQKSSMNGRFLMAAALFASGKESKAIDVYNWIIEKSESDLEVESARNNRNNILRGDNNEY
jgi:tetratricopeptide (TPR) repeat protein